MKQLLVTLVVVCTTIICQAQKKSALLFNTTVRDEWHEFNVDYGPPSTRGAHKDQNVNFGLSITYNKNLINRIYGSIGIGYIQYKSKILRVYNRKFWDDLTALLHYTNDTRYNIISLPVGIDYEFPSSNKLNIRLGTALNFNFSISQKYGMKDDQIDKISRFYFFGVSNQVALAFRQNFSKNKFLELRPFLNVFETWKKDEILYENQNEYHNMNFNALGANLSFGIHF